MGAHLQTELLRCETCDTTATFQVKLVQRTLDDEGKESEETDDLSPQILIGPDEVARLEQLALRVAGTGCPEEEDGEESEHERAHESEHERAHESEHERAHEEDL
ncbi:MAG: hypothetical protein JKY65_13000 [Planctomycetes bacterium]|nr:hypothetical protein [Planctomycetota bacterium]